MDLFIIFAAAKIAGEIFRRLKLPEVVGEILAGVILGPHLLGIFAESEILDVFAEIGVIFLLFYIGLETRASDMFKVGRTAMLVAILGVVVPFGLGMALMLGLAQQTIVALFVAAALVATSVGITVRVLSELGQARSRPARVILGAAVIDDILGLIVLSVVSGLAEGRVSALHIGVVILQALAFTVFVIVVGTRAARRISAHFYRLEIYNPAFVISISICLALSAVAEYIGLAALVGAFLAGMAFAETQEASHIRRSLDGLYILLVPIFFVVMGAEVNVREYFQMNLLLLALIVTLVAIVSKLFACGLAALGLGKREALAVGVGMVPRGEVGIMVAYIGYSKLGIIGSDIYAIVIFMSIVTSLFAPPLLRMILGRQAPPEESEGNKAEKPVEQPAKSQEQNSSAT